MVGNACGGKLGSHGSKAALLSHGGKRRGGGMAMELKSTQMVLRKGVGGKK